MFPRITSALLLFTTALAGLNCSSAGGAPPATATSCLANPDQCPTGETCWPTSATTLACLPSAVSAGFGSPCVETINVATCSDGMICDATDPSGNGQCTSYCISTASCPSGYECEMTSIAGAGGATISICRADGPVTSGGDGGTPQQGSGDGGLPDAELIIPDAAADGGMVQQ